MSRSYSSLLSWFGLTIMASLMLYHTSDRVTVLEKDLRGINVQIESERQSLHVLKAEWTYLSSPTRVEAAAKRHLDLQPTATRRVISASTMASALPLRNGVDPAVLYADAATPQTNSGTDTAPTETVVPVKKPRAFADASRIHINDHVTLQHSVTAEASSDRIGTLIDQLSLRP